MAQTAATGKTNIAALTKADAKPPAFDSREFVKEAEEKEEEEARQRKIEEERKQKEEEERRRIEEELELQRIEDLKADIKDESGFEGNNEIIGYLNQVNWESHLHEDKFKILGWIYNND